MRYVWGRSCVLVDDIVDSAVTLCNAADALKDQGAKKGFAYVTRGVLSGGAGARSLSNGPTGATRTRQNARKLITSTNGISVATRLKK